MTLDEAIKHCEEKEKEQALNGCFACAEEHKQLAEWLKDYKLLLEERPQGDSISRKALKVEFKKIYHCAETMEELANTMEDAIDNAPAVEQKYYERVIAQINPVIEERPQGEWIGKEEYDDYPNKMVCECSECGKMICISHNDFPNFCPDCGADMKGGAE